MIIITIAIMMKALIINDKISDGDGDGPLRKSVSATGLGLLNGKLTLRAHLI